VVNSTERCQAVVEVRKTAADFRRLQLSHGCKRFLFLALTNEECFSFPISRYTERMISETLQSAILNFFPVSK
jgi:hypothetical protein